MTAGLTRSVPYVAKSRAVSEEGLCLIGTFEAPRVEVRREEENMLQLPGAEMLLAGDCECAVCWRIKQNLGRR